VANTPKVLVFLAEGFEELELVAPVDIWRRAGIEVAVASVHDHKLITGARGIKVEADLLLSEVLVSTYNAVFLPGGRQGVLNLSLDSRVAAIAKDFLTQGKTVAAICSAPLVLANAGLLADRQVTCHPAAQPEVARAAAAFIERHVVIDANLITSRGAGTAHRLAYVVATALVGEDKARQVMQEMVFPPVTLEN
jgi:4-methyl-5(b-hydroxyethyl)-thiazole monophosphate biosynthesis